MPSEKLQVVLQLTADQYKREAREAATATGKIGDAAQGATSGVGNLGSSMLSLGAAIGVAGIGKFAFDAVKAAANLEESVNAVNVVFGEAAGKIREFGETSVDAVGLAAVNVNSAATVMGSALINAGFAADEAADKTIELTTRAADMASVFNTEVPEALGAIQSALRGETDPIEKFGVSLTAAAVEAEAAALGYKKVGGEFDVTAKAAARLSIILKQTERVSGDFANTADSTANTMKRMRERFTEMQARIGTALMPAFRSFLDLLEGFAPVLEDSAKAVADLVSEAKPLIDAVAFLREKMDEATESENIFVRATGEAGSAINILSVLTGDYSAAIAAGLSSGDEFITDLEQIGAAAGPAGVGITDLNTAAREAPAAMSDAAEGSDDVGAALGRLFPKISTAAEKYQALAGGIRAVISAQLALANPVLAAVQAKDREIAAAEDLETLRDDEDSTLREIATATLEWNLAVAESVAAQELLREQGIGPTVDALRAMTDQPLTDVLELLRTLELLNEADIRIIMDIDARLSDQLKEILPYLEPGGTGAGGPSGAGIFARQHGGPVQAGRPYWVGEGGGYRELFIPQQSGTVLPHGWTRPNGPTIVVQSPMKEFRTDLQWATIVASVTNMVEQV